MRLRLANGWQVAGCLVSGIKDCEMLVLQRKRHEEIVIGDGIVVVSIVAIRGDTVRLGIEAPKSMPVHRREVYSAIERSGGMKRDADGKPLPLASVLTEREIILEFPDNDALRSAFFNGITLFERKGA